VWGDGRDSAGTSARLVDRFSLGLGSESISRGRRFLLWIVQLRRAQLARSSTSRIRCAKKGVRTRLLGTDEADSRLALPGAVRARPLDTQFGRLLRKGSRTSASKGDDNRRALEFYRCTGRGCLGGRRDLGCKWCSSGKSLHPHSAALLRRPESAPANGSEDPAPSLSLVRTYAADPGPGLCRRLNAAAPDRATQETEDFLLLSYLVPEASRTRARRRWCSWSPLKRRSAGFRPRD